MKKYLQAILYLSVSGTIFAGYLSGVKFFAEKCALDASCATFFGVSTCYFGFGIFLLLLAFSIIAFKKIDVKIIRNGTVPVVTLGIIFSGYYSIVEIIPALQTGFTGTLILPTCTYGLLVYVAILYFASKVDKKQQEKLK